MDETMQTGLTESEQRRMAKAREAQQLLSQVKVAEAFVVLTHTPHAVAQNGAEALEIIALSLGAPGRTR